MVAKVIIRALDIYDDTGSYPRILAASVDFRKYAIISSLDQQNVNALSSLKSACLAIATEMREVLNKKIARNLRSMSCGNWTRDYL